MSAQHAFQRQRIRDSTAGQASKPTQAHMNGGSKKRKAVVEEETIKKKKLRAQNDLPDGFFEDEAQEGESEPDSQAEIATSSMKPAKSAFQPSPSPTDNIPVHSSHSTIDKVPSHFFDTPSENNDPGFIDESEWAAFERDVATPPPPASALTSAATISAAPLTIAEIAAQAREQESLQNKERMEEVIDGEKEDAARRLEEEFAEMAELEERLKRLREKREALRMARREELEGVREEVDRAEDEGGGGIKPMSEGGHDANDDYDDNTASDDNDDWNSWGF
ncbi:hypothetical protein MMC07_000187 [Pseudocyphellaria aurata]|nr:hypothetical protein [Pseudocyphellaria aurata]